MTYGPEDLSRDLTLLGNNAASFKTRARLETFLLDLLREQGGEAVSSLLQALAGHHFNCTSEGSPRTALRCESGRSPQRIVVEAYLDKHAASVNVTLEDDVDDTPQPDPRHRAFYDVWESLLGLADSAVNGLDPMRKAVYLIALLEAEVMNGGLGQYLTNTDGVYVEATVERLARIGADKTRAILLEAAQLGRQSDSYVAAWEDAAAEFERLDDAFLASGEDLAAMTAEVFLQGDAAKGPR